MAVDPMHSKSPCLHFNMLGCHLGFQRIMKKQTTHHCNFQLDQVHLHVLNTLMHW